MSGTARNGWWRLGLLTLLVAAALLALRGIGKGPPADDPRADVQRAGSTATGAPASGAPAAGAPATDGPEAGAPATGASAVDPPAAAPARPLFDGKTLAGWKESNFAGQGEVKIDEGRLILGFGSDLTGITWAEAEPPARDNYEIELEAQRVDGSDFFCGLTFPVGEAPCSLILGGWGGGVIGLSSIDGYDASENETTDYIPFESGKWYRVRVRVTTPRIEAWIDDRQIVDVEREGHEFSTRIEVEPSLPLGIAAWQTTAALRNITLRDLAPTP